MNNDLLDFLADVELAESEDEVFRAWLKAVKRVGFEIVNYIYVRSDEDGNVNASYLTNFSESGMNYYVSKEMQNHDYMIKLIMGKKVTPILYDIDHMSKQQLDSDMKKDIWHWAGESGMKRAMAIPFSDLRGNGVGGVSIGSALLSSDEFQKIITEKGAALFAMAQVAHQRLKHKYMNGDVPGLVKFSPRQTEVIKYLALGLANKEIGYRLNISMPTVSFHLKEIAGKLNVKTNREILPKCIALNLVNSRCIQRAP